MEAQTTDSSDVVFKLLGWLHANRKPVIGVAAAAVVIATGAGLYSWEQGQKESAADAQLLSHPVGGDMRVHDTGNALQELAAEYPSTPGGEYAALLAAEDLFVNGKYPEAEQSFSKFQTDYPSSDLLAQAGLGVAASLEGENKIADATKQYQQVIQVNATDLGVVEPAKLTLGRLQEEQNRPDLAFMQYRELAQSQNPNDLWANEAKERLQLLVGKHPELLKSAMAPTTGATPSPAELAREPVTPTLSAAPAATLSTSPAGSNATPHLLQLPANQAPSQP